MLGGFENNLIHIIKVSHANSQVRGKPPKTGELCAQWFCMLYLIITSPAVDCGGNEREGKLFLHFHILINHPCGDFLRKSQLPKQRRQSTHGTCDINMYRIFYIVRQAK